MKKSIGSKLGLIGSLILFVLMGFWWIGLKNASKKVVIPESMKQTTQNSDWDINLTVDLDPRLKAKIKQKGVMTFTSRLIPSQGNSPYRSDHGTSAVSVPSFPVKLTLDVDKAMRQINPNVSFSEGDVLFTAVRFCPDATDVPSCSQSKSPSLVTRFYVANKGNLKNEANVVLGQLDERRQNPRGPVFLSGKLNTKGIREKLAGFDGNVYLSFRRLPRAPVSPIDQVYLLPVAWHKVNLAADQDSFSIERAATLAPGYSGSLAIRLLLCPKDLGQDPLRCAYESNTNEFAQRMRAYPALSGQVGEFLDVRSSDSRLPAAGDADLQLELYAPM